MSLPATIVEKTSKISESILFLSQKEGRFFVYIYTERLFIRSYQSQDYSNSIKLYGDKELTKYFDHGKPRAEREIQSYLIDRGERFFKKGQPFGIFSIFLRDKNTFIGQVDLVPTKNSGEVEIGWIILKEFQGKGYCSEAIQFFLIPYINKLRANGFTSKTKVIDRIVATAHPFNAVSQKMMIKAGLTKFHAGKRYGGKPRYWYAVDLK